MKTHSVIYTLRNDLSIASRVRISSFGWAVVSIASS